MSRDWTLLPRFSLIKARASRRLMAAVCTAVLLVLAAPSLQARTLKILYAFKGHPDGSGPTAGPVQDKEGNFYSTTYAGGFEDWGTVYRIDPAGKETVLHSFVGKADGVTPAAAPIIDAGGNLYGTTYWGGSPHCFDGNGCGIIYKLSPGKSGWKETILYVFKGGADGAYPGYGTLARDAAGNLYGTTLYGGREHWPKGSGVVFKLTHTSTGWKEHVLHAFGANSLTDGANPYGGVVLDAAGNVYGTTYYGGSSACACGIVFKIDPSGAETVLYNFKGGTTDGGGPSVTLVRDGSGNLYGTTSYGGDVRCSYPIGCGTVFKIDGNGAESVMHVFTGYPFDGAGPGLLVRDQAGNLYGTAGGGNSLTCENNHVPSGCGVIFEVNANGKEIILHNFSSEEGIGPTGLSLYRGKFYGATSASGDGAVFEFTR
jgi:uncharacterized repeat protein (TIGR03803 family)